jgi:hypothetical protein
MRTRFGVKELTFAFLLAAATSTAADEKEPRLKAKEPTVITVHGKQDQVRPEASQAEPAKERNALQRTFYGIGRGFAYVGKGLYKLLDDTFGGDDVIPSPRERTSKEKSEER